MEFRLITQVAPGNQNSDHPSFSYVRVIPYIGAGGQPILQDGGYSNMWGCSRNLNQKGTTVSMPAGPQTAVAITNPYYANFSATPSTVGNALVTISGGTNVVATPNSGGYLRWPGGVNGGSSGASYNQGSGNTVVYLLDNASQQNATQINLAYTTAPTVTIMPAIPTGVTLWYGFWMWVPIFGYGTHDGQYCISLMKPPTVPITILYRKFSYVRAKQQQMGLINRFFKEGAWF
jgi:hypothetical protein